MATTKGLYISYRGGGWGVLQQNGGGGGVNSRFTPMKRGRGGGLVVNPK